jgi:hypothetical protein
MQCYLQDIMLMLFVKMFMHLSLWFWFLLIYNHQNWDRIHLKGYLGSDDEWMHSQLILLDALNN